MIPNMGKVTLEKKHIPKILEGTAPSFISE
jgi:hypothetical protein